MLCLCRWAMSFGFRVRPAQGCLSSATAACGKRIAFLNENFNNRKGCLTNSSPFSPPSGQNTIGATQRRKIGPSPGNCCHHCYREDRTVTGKNKGRSMMSGQTWRSGVTRLFVGWQVVQQGCAPKQNFRHGEAPLRRPSWSAAWYRVQSQWFPSVMDWALNAALDASLAQGPHGLTSGANYSGGALTYRPSSHSTITQRVHALLSSRFWLSLSLPPFSAPSLPSFLCFHNKKISISSSSQRP